MDNQMNTGIEQTAVAVQTTDYNEFVRSGTTSSGFRFVIDVRNITDMRTIRHLGAMFAPGITEGQVIYSSMNYYEIIMGRPQMDKLEDHIRSQNAGFCSFQDFEREVTEIISMVNPVKN
ncbi:MAG: hypothetical protein Q4B85_06675 [Lachnospiraceae bacterium]|nr:hypothetical protein [Lachnospiraceae bacterium]